MRKKLPKVNMNTYLRFRQDLAIDEARRNPQLLRTQFERLQKRDKILADYIWHTAFGHKYNAPHNLTEAEIAERTKFLAVGVGVVMLLERSL